MKNVMTLTLLSGAIILGGIATAEAKQRGGERPTFEQLDTDGDGQITEAEMSARGEARFADADTDGDGALSVEELTARANNASEKRVERMMSRLDTNEDGKLTQDELSKRGRGGDRFAKIDADGSGGISKEEFEAVQKRRKN